jgi:cell division transport system permease protein
VQRIAGLYGSEFALRGLGLPGSAVLVSGGIVLGWLGSFVAATRELRGIEPR